ncbi:hypothetical protein DFQ01_103185 [Paenibacillus cellulosilyticus]|uniref:Uncharacterized protein n=1 Tax=Paenibacillus cellulosilyticus TaxID=375489 RepID=A0A2V2YXB4_9BACL|nr:hypothetical protein [Paenibacillus cellulosilyticus]PWW06283.1 hypothetical protein DFQ01_103185 [Paenibacillus cellulosilyticus]QKS42967.1 hypothetical protein HUB94_00255 [Paenibacillus cellulosilyticus]QKS43491.1 hypothetical protein HUB94_02925 [Paenibacillus cellulosilyticus]
MKDSLKSFESFLVAAASPQPDNLIVIAEYISFEGRAFAKEVSNTIQALEQIKEIVNQVLTNNHPSEEKGRDR